MKYDSPVSFLALVTFFLIHVTRREAHCPSETALVRKVTNGRIIAEILKLSRLRYNDVQITGSRTPISLTHVYINLFLPSLDITTPDVRAHDEPELYETMTA